MSVRVLIADRQPRARGSLKALLTAMGLSTPNDPAQVTHAGAFPIEIVGEAENGNEAVEQLGVLHPDVVIMDLHPHGLTVSEQRMDGLTTIERIKNKWPDTRIVVLTMYATDRASVLNAGTDLFLLKGCPTNVLLEAMMHPGVCGPWLGMETTL